MSEFTYEDLEILKNSMVQLLKTFDGSVGEKQKPDATYLKLVELSKEIKNNCELHGIPASEINDLKIQTSYSLDELLLHQLEKQNLLLDF